MNAKASIVERRTRDRIDQLLCSGAGTDQMLHDLLVICGSSQSAAFDALALVDQHYRRNRLTREAYKILKLQAERLALGLPSAKLPPPGATVGNGHDTTEAVAALTPVATPAPECKKKATVADPAPISLAPGSLLADRYEIEEAVQYGGNATAFRARDRLRSELPVDEQRVVVRCPEPAGEAHREFARAQSLAHQNILRALEFGREGTLTYYTVEWRRGLTLRELMNAMPAGALPMPMALSIVRDVGAAVIYAHARQVVHGTICLENVLICDDGNVRVLNFGSLQAEAQLPEERDDLNALAALAHELLASAHPFKGHTAVEARQLGIRARRPPHLQHNQWRTLQQGLAYSRQHRPLQVRNWLPTLLLSRAATSLPPLRELLSLQPVFWSRKRIGLAAAAALALVAVSAALYFRPNAPAIVPAPITTGAATGSMSAAPLAPVTDVASAMQPEPTVPPPAPADAVAVPVTPSPAPAAAAPAAAPTSVVATPPLAVARPVPIAAPATTPPPVAAADDAELPFELRPGRISFVTERFVVPQAAAAARIRVQRSNGTAGDVSFTWWTEDGTARDGSDYASLGRQTGTIKAGEESTTLFVPIITSTAAGGAAASGGNSPLFVPLVTSARPPGNVEFYVQLGEPTGGAALGRDARISIVLERP